MLPVSSHLCLRATAFDSKRRQHGRTESSIPISEGYKREWSPWLRHLNSAVATWIWPAVTQESQSSESAST